MHEYLLNLASDAVKKVWADLSRSAGVTLTALGVYPCRKGYAQIKDSVLYYIVHYEKGTASELYRTVAAWHGCPAATLESNIRSALKAAYNSGKLLKLNALMDADILDKSGVLPNLQFISLIAQYCYYRILPAAG